jgi:hypothetical protein
MSEIGFSVSCYKGDVPLLRGCLASIRYYAPDAPICLVIDGDFDSRPLERRYGLSTIKRRDVRYPELRRWCFGYGCTKMVAFWESPFEIVIHLDADAVMWGDIRKNIPDFEWDFVHNEPHEEINEFIQKTQYFDPNYVFEYIDKFDWQGNPYFNTGIFLFKRGIFDIDEFCRLMLAREKAAEKFGAGEQGILNIMVFRAIKEGRLKVKQAHLQSAVPVLSKPELESRFQLLDGKPVPWVQPTVVHWAGPKPYMTNPDVFSLPMDYFREIGMREFGLPGWVPAKAAMRADEIWHRDVPRVFTNAKRIVKKMIGRKY